MTDTVLRDVNFRPLKIQRSHEAGQGSSKSSNKKRVFKINDMGDDEYIRQYLLFHYQLEKSEGFMIDWEQFDYVFRVKSLDNPPSSISSTQSIAQIIREVTLCAIEKHNEATGTNLVFVEHVQANFQWLNGMMCWVTFWAMDMNSSTPESKIYQAKVWRCGNRYEFLIFRPKPTDEEIASVDVEPPSPKEYEDSDEIALVFARAGPEDDPGVPFVFHRTGSGDNPPQRLSSRRSSAQMICDVTLRAIEKQNEDMGKKLVLVEHIRANYQWHGGIMCWLTFWAVDMNSSTPESKIYQAKVWSRGKKEFELHIFRLKPTDEEEIDVEPPSPMDCDESDDIAIVFARSGHVESLLFSIELELVLNLIALFPERKEC